MISAKQRIYLTGLIFLAIFICVFFTAVLPMAGKVKNNSDELALKEEILVILESQLSAFRDFQSQYSVYSEYASTTKDSFVTADAPIGFMEFIEEQAELFGLELEVASLSVPDESGMSTGFQVMIDGNFINCIKFLERLEYGPWMIAIPETRITRISERSLRTEEESDLQVGDTSFAIIVHALAE